MHTSPGIIELHKVHLGCPPLSGMFSQMEEAEQQRLRPCGLDYIGLLIANHYKSTFLNLSFLCRMLINPFL